MKEIVSALLMVHGMVTPAWAQDSRRADVVQVIAQAEISDFKIERWSTEQLVRHFVGKHDGKWVKVATLLKERAPEELSEQQFYAERLKAHASSKVKFERVSASKVAVSYKSTVVMMEFLNGEGTQVRVNNHLVDLNGKRSAEEYFEAFRKAFDKKSVTASLIDLVFPQAHAFFGGMGAILPMMLFLPMIMSMSQRDSVSASNCNTTSSASSMMPMILGMGLGGAIGGGMGAALGMLGGLALGGGGGLFGGGPTSGCQAQATALQRNLYPNPQLQGSQVTLQQPQPVPVRRTVSSDQPTQVYRALKVPRQPAAGKQ